MKIIIEIKEKKITLTLFSDKKKIDSREIKKEHSLSQKLLTTISAIISRNKLKTSDISKIEVKSDQGDNFTTTRLAKTVANTWNWAGKM